MDFISGPLKKQMRGLPMEPTLVVEIVALRKCLLFRMVEVVLMAQCFHLNAQIFG